MQDAPDSRAFALHDHAHCAVDVMARAEVLARDKGLRLTPVRRRTLEILLEAHRALGAYDVLNRLSAEGYGTSPPWLTARWSFWWSRCWPTASAV